MYNEDIPTRAELPSAQQLLKSTGIAFAAAVVMLVTVILPSEYAIDPTGIGRAIGLTQMGEIKEQLAIEAEEDRAQTSSLKNDNSFLKTLASVFTISSAHAQSSSTGWDEEVSFELVPGQGTEYKLTMKKGAVVTFDWFAEGGRANYDLHGDNKTQAISYKKGRGVTGEQGDLVAKFDGNHGWFWRNRDMQPIKITLRVKGDFGALKHMK